MKSNRMFKIFFVGMFLFIIASVGQRMLVDYQDNKDGCKPTGEQRMVNSVINAPNGALTGLVVQDKLVCDNGRMTWKTQYE